jgi:cytochrome c oxidase subunit 2
MTALTAWLLSSTAHAGEEGTFWMPPQASTFAEDVDFAFYFIYWVDLIFFIILMVGMLYLAVRYRYRSAEDRTIDIKGNHTVEMIWAVFPSFLLIAMFVLGFNAYMKQSIPPADAMEVRVTAQKWSWTFDYPSLGIEGEKVLVVPQGKPVRLTMTSRDVLHSFFVPDFRVKKDVIPGRYSVLWFQADEIFAARPDQGRGPNDEGDMVSGLGEGEHQVFCTEYCGTDHSRMYSRVRVLAEDDFDAWAKAINNIDLTVLTSTERGEYYYKKKGCNGCHSVDGSQLVGPSFKGLYGRNENVDGGQVVKVDDNYLSESILVPGAKVVDGYANQMPSFQGQLDTEQVTDIIEFIKSTK